MTWTRVAFAFGIAMLLTGSIPWAICRIRRIDPDGAPRIREVSRLARSLPPDEIPTIVWLASSRMWLRRRHGLVLVGSALTLASVVTGLILGDW